MKKYFLLSATLCMLLAGCSALSPVTPASLPAAGADSKVAATSRFERLRVSNPFLGGFTAKVARYEHLAGVRFSVSGQGISARQSNSTAVEVDLSDASGFGAAEASLDDIPQSDGAWRVVTAQGLDADGEPLPAFVAKGVYRSEDGVDSVSISLSRQGLALARGIERLIENDDDALADLEPEHLPTMQVNLDDYQDYSNSTDNRFEGREPLTFRVDELAEAIADGSLLADSPTFSSAAFGTVSVNLVSSNEFNDVLAGDVTLSINDPSSAPVQLSRFASFDSYDLERVMPGTWTIEARGSQGELLDSAEIEVDEDGQLVSSTPELEVPGLAY